MEVASADPYLWEGSTYSFCADRCRTLFIGDPERYLAESCLVCRSEGIFTPVNFQDAFAATWQGETYPLCTADHRAAFQSDAAGYFMHTMWGIPNHLYYASIALILILSFGIFEWRAKKQETGFAIGSGGELTYLQNNTQRNLLDVCHPQGSVPAGLGVLPSRQDHGPTQSPRLDFTQYPWFRAILIHPATRFVARAIIVVLFLFIISAGLFGNQLPSKNIAPLLTWTIWWGGLIAFVLYAGSAWCYVCPWEAIADWAEGLRFWGTKKEGTGLGLKVPKLLRTIWPAIILFIALTWVELGFGVTMSPRATAWLALSILAMAFICAFLFERKAFCRYGCLVGRIMGLYSLFSPVEIRAKDREACRTCETKSCYKGNDQGEPCPTAQYLPTMHQSTYCIACMECLKSCEKKNVALQLRPWGEDIAHPFRPKYDEAYLAILLITLTGFHGLTMTAVWRQLIAWIDATTGMGETAAFSLGMAAIMIGPGLVYAALVAISRWLAAESTLRYRDYFIRYAYALLPIALFYHLAHNSEHLLMEGQKIVALASDPFGWEWNLFGTATWTLSPMVDLSTLWIVQVFLVMVGHIYSLWVARRVAGPLFKNPARAFRSQLPMLTAMILFSVMSLWLLKQPMEMRTSAM
jgi:YHS domain-containing protein